MNNETVTYVSYQLQNGKWVPCARLREYLSESVKERDLTWDELFDSRKEADEFAQTKLDEESKRPSF